MLRRAAACALEATAAAVVASASRAASGAACSTSGRIRSGNGAFDRTGGSESIMSLLLRGSPKATSSAPFLRHASSSAALRPKASSPLHQQKQTAFAWYSRIQESLDSNSRATAAVAPWRLLPLSPARTPATPLPTTMRPPPERQQGEEGTSPLIPLRADSVRRKRKHKMNKHKHRKRRKLLRHKSK